MKPEERLPLDGITVIDLSQIYNGPYATYLMALAGARVIKVEPKGGEPLRRRGVVGGAALPFAMLNGCKESIVLDLKTGAGKAALIGLVRDADVIVENFAPGVMQRLGLGAERLQQENPRLIYAASSGFGSEGPYRDYPAMDLTIQAMAGIMHATGFPDRPPVKAGPAVGDFFAGIHLYGAIATALFERERTGLARRVEVAMQDAVYASLASNLGMQWSAANTGTADQAPPRTGNRHGGLAEAPYNVYRTADGYIAIICVGEVHWRTLAGLMGKPDLATDPRFATLQERVRHMDEIDALVQGWTGTQDTEPLFRSMIGARVPCAPVRTLTQVMEDPNLHARGAVEWIDHPEFGRMVVQHSPLRYAGATRRKLEPSHTLGADTKAVLKERLGLSDADIAELLAS